MTLAALSRPLAGLVLAAALGQGWAQPQAPAGIYTCVDAKGRRLTSDRPIVDCLDREQKELNSSGTVRRTLGPSLTASERAAREERDRKAAEERQRQLHPAVAKPTAAGAVGAQQGRDLAWGQDRGTVD